MTEIDPGDTTVLDRLGTGFAKLWAASTASALGSGLAAVAAPLLIAARTDNPLVVSLAAAVTWLPWLLFALPGGVVVDRLDRRHVMVVIDWVRVVAMAVLGVAILTDHAGLDLLYIVLFVVNTGEVVLRTASQAMIPALVPREKFERANGWLTGGAMLAQSMIAGPLGAFLFVVGASAPFFANAGTYVLSAVLIWLIAGRFRAEPKPNAVEGVRSSIRADIGEGLRWLLRNRLLRTMAVLIGLLNVTLTAALAILVLLAKHRLHLGSVGYGALFTCMAIGGIVGSLLGDRMIKKFTATWTIRIGLLIEAGLHLVLATSRSAYVVGLALAVFGVHGALWSIAANSLRQRLTPPDMLGRVGSSTMFLAAGGNCVGALLGGVLAARFGLTAPYWVAFVVAVIVSVTTWRVFDRETVEAAYATPAL